MHPSEPPLITAEAIRDRVGELAQSIAHDYRDKDVVVIPVLKGAIHFASDLIRALDVPVTLDFIRAVSYEGTESNGAVEIVVPTSEPLAGRHVLVVEDILDTGRTTSVVLDTIRNENPASVALATLLNKSARRVIPIDADYIGFEIDDHFVVGYGMDYNEDYRGLPAVHILAPN